MHASCIFVWCVWICHCVIIIILIRYIYHVLINALSAHMIHINLHMIFYTHVEHSHPWCLWSMGLPGLNVGDDSPSSSTHQDALQSSRTWLYKVMTLLTAKLSVKNNCEQNADHELTLGLFVRGRIWWRRWWFFAAQWSCHADRQQVVGKPCQRGWVSTPPCWQHRAVWPPPAPISVTPTMMWVCTPGSTYIAFKVMGGGSIFQEKNSHLCAIWWIVVFNTISIFTRFKKKNQNCAGFSLTFLQNIQVRSWRFLQKVEMKVIFCMTGLQNYNIILT